MTTTRLFARRCDEFWATAREERSHQVPTLGSVVAGEPSEGGSGGGILTIRLGRHLTSRP